MAVNWDDVATAIESDDADRVNDVIDRLEALDRNTRRQLFTARFGDLVAIYEEQDSGYARQSVVRVLEVLGPGMVDAHRVQMTEGDVERVAERLDTTCGFLLTAIQDSDGRVRQSAVRALKDVYRGYEVLEDRATLEAIAAELDEIASKYDGSRRDHVLDSKEDAAYFAGVGAGKFGEILDEMSESEAERPG